MNIIEIIDAWGFTFDSDLAGAVRSFVRYSQAPEEDKEARLREVNLFLTRASSRKPNIKWSGYFEDISVSSIISRFHLTEEEGSFLFAIHYKVLDFQRAFNVIDSLLDQSVNDDEL